MKRLIICALALLTLAVACKKEEFQQAPYGEKVPFADTAKYDLKVLIGASATHKLFYAAWQRSHADSVLHSRGIAGFTVLAPDDAAMRAAGYDEAAIAGAVVTDIDSLVLFHILGVKIDSMAVAPLNMSTGMNTVLTHATLKEYLLNVGSSVPGYKPLRFRQFLSINNGRLFLNGKDAGNAQPLQATNGTVWPINHVTKKPKEHIIDLLARDPRFSIFYELVRRTNEEWPILSEYMYERGYFNPLYPGQYNEIGNDMFFAPTNEAFANAGFNTFDDLWALNERSMPYFDWDWFEMRNNFVSDSLLAYHMLGRYYAPSGSWGPGRAMPAVLFGTDLKNDLLKDYAVNAREPYSNIPPFIIPLDFGSEGGQVTVKVKGADKPAAKIIEADIMTYEGPVHVVDHLLLSDKVQL
ncbi:fasciclin domain-containing protein [Chitinophaga sedimenti]|uniref:fasciclin domain-containing protein n=1 Tax=Chitinophaga sedimenti TaxID=2033606 RepID=UPI00200319A7|nr:fasciclin domain-containing protein [Chitinophaga sedimenti]MCK7554182.1 fasciclin domain-containing protein [Chitinophaga sedimenti]